MVSVDGLTVEFSGTTLFKDISFVINDKDRIALMGKNGAGKSTLLKILAGVRTPNRGKVTVSDGGKIGYLPQHLMVENGRTVFEEACLAFEHLFEIEREIARINDELTVRTQSQRLDRFQFMAAAVLIQYLIKNFIIVERFGNRDLQISVFLRYVSESRQIQRQHDGRKQKREYACQSDIAGAADDADRHGDEDCRKQNAKG